MDEDEPRFVLFTDCRFDGESTRASGQLRDVMIHERLLIKANGGDVVMVVTGTRIDYGVAGMFWDAVDEATFRSRSRPVEMQR